MAWFLSDVTNKTETVPILSSGNWHWEANRTNGRLIDPDGTAHCIFDLSSGTIQYEPNGEVTEAPGLSLPLVEEMGERYATTCCFDETMQEQYQSFLTERQEAKRNFEKSVRNDIKGHLQLHVTATKWETIVDTDFVKDWLGKEVPSKVSKDEGIALFNELCESKGVAPLRDPVGYMPLTPNMYELIQKEYRNQYETKLDEIDNGMSIGSGYGVEAVLKNLSSTVRENMQKQCLPPGVRYGDLRFMDVTPERKAAVKDFVHWRVNKTVVYEVRRSIDPAKQERDNAKFQEAANRLKASLSPAKQQAEALSL